MSLLRALLAAFFALALLTGCASTSEPGDTQYAQDDDAFDDDDLEDIDEDVDPLEGLNRFLFAFNDMLDTVVFQPLAATYRVMLPEVVRDSIRNFLRNINTPVILANDVFQGSWDRAETTLMRFVINTTVGVAGFMDQADGMGYPYHSEDFGQTLGHYGVGPYPYIVIPILGPSTARDGVGLLVDTYLDPLTYLLDDEVLIGRRAAEGIDFRSRNIETIEELKRDSIDYYARIRSVYLQRRADEINNGRRDEGAPAPGISGGDSGSDQLGNFE